MLPQSRRIGAAAGAPSQFWCALARRSCSSLPLTFIGLEAGLNAFLVEELFHAFGAPVFGITMECLIEFCIQIVFVLFPCQLAAALEADLGGTQHHRIFLSQLFR